MSCIITHYIYWLVYRQARLFIKWFQAATIDKPVSGRMMCWMFEPILSSLQGYWEDLEKEHRQSTSQSCLGLWWIKLGDIKREWNGLRLYVIQTQGMLQPSSTSPMRKPANGSWFYIQHLGSMSCLALFMETLGVHNVWIYMQKYRNRPTLLTWATDVARLPIWDADALHDGSLVCRAADVKLPTTP